MKICAYTNVYVPHVNAGAQTMLRDLLRTLKAEGHDIAVVWHNSSAHEPYEWEGIPVYPNTDKYVALHWVPWADLVITHLEATERAAILAARYNIPVVHLVHNTMAQTHGYLAYRNDLTVYNSNYVRDGFPENEAPSIVVHPPIDPAEYRTGHGSAVTLVNLYRPKGTDTFYAVAQAMPAQRFLAVAGGYGAQDVRELPNVEHHPNVEDMRQVYCLTKVVLMPSEYESFGRIAIEAAASGIPTIAHPTPGLKEALGPSGIYVDRDDTAGWVAEIRRLTSPRGFGLARKNAQQRSAYWAKETVGELNAFTDAIALVGRARGTRGP